MVLLIVLLALFSCSMTKEAPPEATPPPTPAYLLPNTPGEAHDLSKRLARVAESVPEVKHATVVVTHTTAIVGLDLKSVNDEDEVFKEVAARLDKEDARIHTVRVTSNKETVERIKQVAGGIADGKPVSEFSREIVDIMRETTRIRL
jgi:YhcN/YlaJ family sporulation lipoprotein